MTLSPRLQKPSAQPIVTQGLTGAEILGQMAESVLCWTIPGYAFFAASVRKEDGPRKEQGHQAF